MFLQGENQITDLIDLDKCVALKMLHLRGNGDSTNPIEKLDGFSKNMIALQYLNMRQVLHLLLERPEIIGLAPYRRDPV